MGLILRSTAWALAFLAAAAVLALWLVPRHLDWTEYRAELQRIGAARLGREVRIDGAFALEMLPQPRLTARGVSIGDAGDGFRGAAQEIRLGLALWPLLGGRIVVTDLTLVAPRLSLAGLPAPLREMAGRPAPLLAGAEIRLVDGEITLGGVRLSGVRARLTAGAAHGPYMAEGRFDIAATPVDFSLALGQPGFDGAAALEATLATRGARLAASGVAWHGGFAFAGTVRAEGSDLSALLPGPALPFRAEARLSTEGGAATADQVQLEIGGSRLTGAASLRLGANPRADIALAAVRLDLDPWIVPARGLIASPPLPVGLDLSVEAASLFGGTLRALRVAAVVADGQVAVNEATALLPGGAELALAGSVSGDDRGARFDGLVELDAPDLRGLLAWLGGVPGWAGPEVLRALRVSGGLVAEPGQVRIEAAEGTALDGVAVTGTLGLSTAGARPALTAALKLDRLDPAPWLAGRLPAPESAALAAFDLALRLEIGVVPMAALTAREVTLEGSLEAGRATLRRLAIADIAGGRLGASAAGTLGPGARLTGLELSFAGTDVAGLVPIVPWRVVAAARPLWLGGYTLRASARAEGEGLAFTAVAEAMDARVEATGTADRGLDTVAGRIALRHPGAPRLLQALGLDDPTPWLGEGALTLVAETTTQRTERGRRITLRASELGLGRMRAQLSGEIALDAEARRAALTVEAERLPLPGLDLYSAALLPPAILPGWTAAVVLRAGEMPVGGTAVLSRVDAALDLADGALAVTRFAATLGGGRVQGTLRLDPVNRSLVVEAAVADAVLAGPLTGLAYDLGGGRVRAEARLRAAGTSPLTLLASLAGEVRLAVTEGVMVGFDLAQVAEVLQSPVPPEQALAALRAALTEGATGFDRLEARIAVNEGIATLGQSQLAAQAGTAQILGEVDLRGGTLDLGVTLAPLGAEPLPRIELRATGSWQAPLRVPETAGAARFLAERAAQPRR
ncbi:AsmA family protein [Elioraea sp. Yellowstone]|uniref:AsmA family protein n=1 Tax=Elioraea sp. Yellowstone TaxID=2592070 RepID=UPI001386D604|nr:AsmA family protein [Elioraea sp. Yellowstone]